MDKKTRILELVKKNIITAEEAIELLEKIEAKETTEVVTPLEPNNQTEVVVADSDVQTTDDTFSNPELTDEEKIFETLKDLEEAQNTEESIEDSDNSDEETEKSEFSEQVNQMFNQAKTEFEKAKPQIKEVSKQTAEALKSTFSLLTGTVKDYMKSEENPFAWAGGATTTIEKDYQFSEIEVIDIQETNGKIELSLSDDETVNIHATIKIYGSLEEVDALELFDAKSKVLVEDKQLNFAVLNNRMNVNLDVKIPKSKLNHLSVKTINGTIKLADILVEDVYLKSTNGGIKVEATTVTNLEVEGVNGDIKLAQNNILKTDISSINGNVTGNSDLEAIKVKLVNGDIKLSLNNDSLKSINATNANGNIKVAIPRKLGLDGEVKTTFGKIHERLEDLSTATTQNEVSAKSKIVKRQGASIIDLSLTTTTGNIYLKDAEK